MCMSVSDRCEAKPASRTAAAAKRGFGAGGASSTTNRRAAAASPIRLVPEALIVRCVR